MLPSFACRPSTDIRSSFKDKMNNQQQYQQPMQPNYSQPQQPVYGQQQPITEKSQHSHGSNWNNGLCDCAPCELCLKVYFCACFQVGQTQARNKGERNPGFFEFNSDVSQSCNPLPQSVADSGTPVPDLVRCAVLGRLAMDSTDDQPR